MLLFGFNAFFFRGGQFRARSLMSNKRMGLVHTSRISSQRQASASVLNGAGWRSMRYAGSPAPASNGVIRLSSGRIIQRSSPKVIRSQVFGHSKGDFTTKFISALTVTGRRLLRKPPAVIADEVCIAAVFEMTQKLMAPPQSFSHAAGVYFKSQLTDTPAFEKTVLNAASISAKLSTRRNKV